MGQREIIINAGRRDIGSLTFEIGPGDADGNFIIGNDVNSTSRAGFGYSDAQSVFFDQVSGLDTNSGTRASPYQTPWKAFGDVDNSTKFVAVQLDTNDINIGTIPKRLETDKNLGSASDLIPDFKGVYEGSLPTGDAVYLFEANSDRLILVSQDAVVYYTDNLGNNWESTGHDLTTALAYGSNLKGTDNLLLGEEGADEDNMIFLSSSDNGDSYTTITPQDMSLDTGTAGDLTFTSLEAINGATDSAFTRKWFMSILDTAGTNREIIHTTDQNITSSTAWLSGFTDANTNVFKYFAEDGGGNCVFLTQTNSDVLHYDDNGDTFDLLSTLPAAWSGSGRGVAWNGSRFMAISSDADFMISVDGSDSSWSTVTGPGITPLGIGAIDGHFWVYDAADIYITSDNGTTWDQITEVSSYADGDSLRQNIAGLYNRNIMTITDRSDNELFIFSDGTKTLNMTGCAGYTLTNDFINAGQLAGVTKSATMDYLTGDQTQVSVGGLTGFGGATSSTLTQSDYTGAVTISSDESGEIIFTKNEVQANLSINANSGTVMDNLVVGTQTLTKKEDDTLKIKLQNNTLIGNLTIDNSALTVANGTGFTVADNLHEGSITGSTASNLVTFQSGNVRGTISNISNIGMSSENPLFANTTDYKLQYIVNGFNINSPFINSSLLTVTATSGERRAYGAWSFDTSTVTKGFSLSERIPLPQEKNSGLRWIQNNVANLQIPEGGQPDVFNNITKQTEELIINYRSVERKVINFFNLLETTFQDMTVEIILQPDLLSNFPTSVTANGAQTAGTAVVNVNATGKIFPGYLVTIDGVDYHVLYPIPLTGNTTSIVLDRVTETDLADTEIITVKAPIEKSQWQYVPDPKKEVGATIPELVSLQTEPDQGVYWNGLKLRFIRKRNG